MVNLYTVLALFLSLVCAYLIGSVNASIVLSKLKGEDIRNAGSKNAGLTNALRVYGKKIAVFVFIWDLSKGILSVLLIKWLVSVLFSGETALYAQYMAALGVVLGHNFPLYFGFKGGKGILTSWGVIMVLDWRISIILIIIFLLVVTLTRYVSLGSVLCSASYPLWVILFTYGKSFTAKGMYISVAVIMGALAFYRHKANIKRLLSGTENKLGAKKQ